jgi:RNAse (barnase) inhibitor barstar
MSDGKRIYVIDGSVFRTLEESAAEFTRVLGLTSPWNGNLDAFNDFLRGGFGTPDEGFVLIWRNSGLSKDRLGYVETSRWLEEDLKTCHPANVPSLHARLTGARRHEGGTLFDTLVEIIRDHDNIELRLE